MAATAPMRDGPPAGSGTGGDSRVTTTSTPSAAAATTTNFEYDDNEWEIGIGNLIIDLDADIEKTNEKSNVGNLTSASGSSMAAASATNAASGGSGSSGKTNKSGSGGGGSSVSSGSSSSSSGGSCSGSSGGGSNSSSSSSSSSSNSNSSNSSSNSNSSSSSTSSSASVEHSSMVDNKSLKMKIKRTKSGSKSSEKHEIVKPNEQNGGEAANPLGGNAAEGKASTSSKHSTSNSVNNSGNANIATAESTTTTTTTGSGATANNCGITSTSVSSGGGNKRGSSSSHRRDKTKEKHGSSGDKATSKLPNASGQSASISATTAVPPTASNSSNATDLNGIVRTPLQRVMYPIQTNGPGPPNAPILAHPSPSKEQPKAITPNTIPATSATQQTSLPQVTTIPVASNAPNATSLNQSLSSSTANASAIGSVNSWSENGSSNIASSVAATAAAAPATNVYSSMAEDGVLTRPPSPSSPPCKKIKTVNCLPNDSKETKDACVGTSISTMTEPDCLGPCEPGTSVTLEGIVWHETEGVLVVNVTWRGKTYVGTLLDCTRHDWAPPRFCDSPTSDLDARLPKGRAKRGRAATNDLSNFTETRSSVHSKLRSSSNGSNKGTRKGLSSSPTPFVSPRPDSGSSKRKNRPPEEESASPQGNGSKKSKCSSQTATFSPPSSPVFFECPEANCSKKYKHLNGLKYHQSHAHGGLCGADDEDATKESASTSENEEIPSPTDSQSTKSERKDENSESEPATPISEAALSCLNLPASPHTQPSTTTNLSQPSEPVRVELTPPPVDNKTVVKPGVLRYGVSAVTAEDVGSTSANPKMTTAAMRLVTTPTAANNLPALSLSSTAVTKTHSSTSPPPPSVSQQVPLSPPQNSAAGLPHPFSLGQPLQSSQAVQSLPLSATTTSKLPQFKVKPASVLLQDDKMKDKTKCQVQKKKNRKSPAGSPHPQPMELSQYKIESAAREDVHSPAYSDISDDGAPVLEAEVADPKNKSLQMDKKSAESSAAHSPHAMQHYNMYPFFTQPPYLVPSVQPDKVKEEKGDESKLCDKEKKDSDVSQKLLPSHFYPYESYVANYGYNLSQNYPISVVSNNEKEIKEESKSPGPTDLVKQPAANPHVPQNVGPYSSNLSSKSKMESSQAKIGGDTYGGKDGSEARSPLNVSSPYLHSRQQPHMQQMQPLSMPQMQAHSQSQSQAQQMSPQLQQQMAMQQMNQAHQQSHEDMRRYYGNVYPDQRRKDQHSGHLEAPLKATAPTSVSSKSNSSVSGSKHKEKQLDEKKEDKVKQEGVKPTMETQGPPPPPTSSYTYFHPSSYLQPPYVPFDPAAHSVYRGMNPMIMPTGPYGNSPYLHHPAQMHAQMPRYHAPEDLSRPPSGSSTKALDLLHHQASQYYSPSHKIHELQERALKSPTPKVSTTIASPAASANGQPTTLNTSQIPPTSTSDRLSGSGSTQSVKSGVDGKDSRSPPPQRHVHTHHHTHVGLGYPLLPGQYPAPYGAAVLASEQAAAVASAGSNPYSPK